MMSDRTKRMIVIATRVLSVVGIAFLAKNLVSHWAEIASMRWNLESGLAVTVAVAYWVILYLTGSSAWQILVQAGGGQLNFRKSLEIIGKAQISKYLPGNVFHYVSRASLASEAGVPVGISAASIVAETFFAVCAALFVASVGAVVYGGTLLTITAPYVQTYRLGLFVASAIGFIFVLFAVWRYTPAREWITNHRGYFSVAVVGNVLLRLGFFYVTAGVVLNLLASSFWSGGNIGWFDASWRFTAAWLLGFLMPGAPGGIGVREAVMLALFSTPIGSGPAAGLAIVVRFVTIVADIIMYGLASYLSKTSMPNRNLNRIDHGIS